METPRRLRAWLAAPFGFVSALAALSLGAVSCDPGPTYWLLWSLAPLPAIAVCAWAGITARPRGVLVLAPTLFGGMLAAAVTALFLFQAYGSRPDETTPPRAERCSEDDRA